MATRPVRFELHILPLIRRIDHEGMIGLFDLYDYDQVKAHADDILVRTANDMPPRGFGGPWPAEWVALLQRWKDEGFLRLDLGTPDAGGYTATLAGGAVTLGCRGTVPTAGYRTWLDAVVPDGGPREYVHYWEPPVPAQAAAPTLFRARTTFPAPTAVTSVAVTDAAGRHVVPIVAGPTPVAAGPADLPAVEKALAGLGATKLGSAPTAGGEVHRFRVGAADVEVFRDARGVDVEAPADVLDRLRPALPPPAPRPRP